MSGKRGGNDDDTKRAILKRALHIRWTCIRGGNLYSKLPYILQIAIPVLLCHFSTFIPIYSKIGISQAQGH
jgi:hypothetical protein